MMDNLSSISAAEAAYVKLTLNMSRARALINFHHRTFIASVMTDSPDKKEASPSPRRLVAGVIVTHGHLANELLAAAEMIVGAVSHITFVSIGWHDDVDAAHSEVERAIRQVSQGRGVLLLTDMFGGTPTNIGAMFLAEGEVEVVTGVNLPMVIKLASQSEEESLADVARRVRDQGREGIYLAGELLAPQQKS